MLYLKRWLISLVLLTVMCASQANESSLDQFIKHRIASLNLDSSPLLADEIQPHSPGWIDATEVRLGADNDNDNKRSLALRLKLNNTGRIDVEEDILKLQRQALRLDHQNYLNRELETLYFQILELISQHELLGHLHKESSLVATEVSYFRQLAQTSEFKPDDLLESELAQTQLKSQIEIHRQDISDLKDAMGFTFDMPELTLTSEQMLELVTRYQQETHLDVAQAQIQFQLSQLALKHERAAEGLALNAVQLESEYADDRDNVLSIRFDVQIPFSGPTFNSAQKQQDLTQARYKMQRIQQQASNKSLQLLQKIKQNNSRIFTFEQLATQLQTRIDNATNASLILKLKQQHLAQLKRVMQARQVTRQYYIEFLADSGMLAKKPASNWLLLK